MNCFSDLAVKRDTGITSKAILGIFSILFRAVQMYVLNVLFRLAMLICVCAGMAKAVQLVGRRSYQPQREYRRASGGRLQPEPPATCLCLLHQKEPREKDRKHLGFNKSLFCYCGNSSSEHVEKNRLEQAAQLSFFTPEVPGVLIKTGKFEKKLHFK